MPGQNKILPIGLSSLTSKNADSGHTKRTLIQRYRQPLLLLLIFIVASPLMFTKICGTRKTSQVLFLTIVMTVSWATEVINIAFTSLLPVLFLPLFGIVTGKDIAIKYFPNTNLLIFGASIFSSAVKKYALHRRIALTALEHFGNSPRKLILSFMCISAFISMWLSNTSTSVLMMPIAVNIVDSMRSSETLNKKKKEIEELRNNINRDKARLKELEQEIDEPRGCLQTNQLIPSGQPISPQETTTEVLREKEEIVGPEKVQVDKKEAGDHGYNDNNDGEDNTSTTYLRFRTALVLSIAYSCTLGGMSTLTGTGTNLAFIGMLEELYPQADSISMGQWFSFGFPLSFTFIILLWFYFCFTYLHGKNTDFSFLAGSKSHFRKCLDDMGSMTMSQKILIVDFCFLILLWFTRKPGMVDGWASLFGPDGAKYITDGTIVIGCVFPLFFIQKPISEQTETERNGDKPVPMLTVRVIEQAPWATMILIGGGFGLAKGYSSSGLSQCIADGLSGLSGIPYFAILVICCFTASCMSEFISNVSTASILIPIISSVCNALKIDPLSVLIPVALSCSCSFMLPVSTPPNSVAYGTGFLTVVDMVKKGFVLNIAGFMLVFLMFISIGIPIFNVDLEKQPSWAWSNNTGASQDHT